MSRISRDVLFMEIAKLMAARSTCTRGNVGAVIVRDRRIVVTGYNGAPSNMAHCLDVGCDLGPGGGCQRAVHAEANAIAFAARDGISLLGTTLYSTHAPCRKCAELIVNAGIKIVVYNIAYRDPAGLDLLDLAGVEFHEYQA
jgi:dCMP deaminase